MKVGLPVIFRYKSMIRFLPLAGVLLLVLLGVARFVLSGDVSGLVIALVISLFSVISLLPLWTYRLVFGPKRLQSASVIKI